MVKIKIIKQGHSQQIIIPGKISTNLKIGDFVQVGIMGKDTFLAKLNNPMTWKSKKNKLNKNFCITIPPTYLQYYNLKLGEEYDFEIFKY